MKVLTLIGIFLLTFAMAANAASSEKQAVYNIPDAKSYNGHFGDMDPNKDGMVTWQEFKAHFPNANEKVFAGIDLNKDGAIDHDEWHQFKEAYDLKHKD